MEKNIDAVEKVLGEPITAEPSEYLRKIRNNLFIVSTVAIFVVIGGVEINPNSTIFGLNFTNLSPTHLVVGLFATNLYMLLHFTWCSFDLMLEWVVRITGTRVAFVTAGTFASEEGDYPSDPRQSTLYNWWLDQAKEIGSLRQPIDIINAQLTEYEAKVKTALDSNDPNAGAAFSSINSVKTEIAKLQSSINKTEITFKALRPSASLKRFDQRFSLLLRSQNLRTLIIELIFPIFLGIYSVFLLTTML